MRRDRKAAYMGKDLLGERQESRVEIAQHNSGSLHKVGHFV